MADALRPTPNSDGVTDRWYETPAGNVVLIRDLDQRADFNEFLYYALGTPQRTLRPNYDRHTEFPNLP